MTFAAPTLSAICPWNAGTRTADRADSHGHRPQNQADLPKHRDASPGGGNGAGRATTSWPISSRRGWEAAWYGIFALFPVDLDELAGILDFAGYSPQRQRLIGYGRCVRSPKPGRMRSRKTRTGVSARPRRRDVRAGGAAS